MPELLINNIFLCKNKKNNNLILSLDYWWQLYLLAVFIIKKNGLFRLKLNVASKASDNL